jgi:diguanylate cyclase (GGDEF)-like protein
MTTASSRPIHVLLVDGEIERAEALADELRTCSTARGVAFEVDVATELRLALARLAQGGVDVVLLDIVLPDSQGMVTFDQAYAFAPGVPIVVLTDVDDPGVAVSAVQGGAQDFLVRGAVEIRLLTRAVRYAIERHRLLSALRSLSLIDDLTGLYNRRGFMELGTQFLKLSRRSGRGASLLYLDLDRFKDINDAHGHHVGDAALVQLAEILRAAFRRSDLIARMGGDEFAVLAPAGVGEPAELLGGRVRQGIQAFNLSHADRYRLRASIGVARSDNEDRSSLTDLLARADAAMYEEKRGKRRAVAP